METSLPTEHITDDCYDKDTDCTSKSADTSIEIDSPDESLPIDPTTGDEVVKGEEFVGFSPPSSPGKNLTQIVRQLEDEISDLNSTIKMNPENKSEGSTSPIYLDNRESDVKNEEKELPETVSSRTVELNFAGRRKGRSSRGSSPCDSVSSRESVRRSVSVSSRDSKGSLKSGAPFQSAVRYQLPFENGWRREILLKEIGADVTYIHPSGLKLKSLREVSENLTEGLSSENFTFAPQPLNVSPDYEFVSKETPSIRKSGRVITPSTNYKIVEMREEESRKRGSSGTLDTAMAPPAKREKLVLKLNRTGAKKSESESDSKSDTKNLEQNELCDDESTPHHHPKAPKGPMRKITLGRLSNNNEKPEIGLFKQKVNRKLGPTRRRPIDGRVKKPTENAWETAKPSPDEPRRICSIACPKAMGLIPTLQCCVCLCLYHPECADVTRASPTIQVSAYVCKNCRSKPDVRKPRAEVTITSPPAKSPPAAPAPVPPVTQPVVQSVPQTLVTVNRRRFIMVPDLSTPPAVTPTSSRMLLQQPQPADLPSGNMENSLAEEPEGAATKKFKPIDSGRTPNFMHNICMGYTALLHVFDFLTIQELGRAARVCRLWRDLARHESLWRTVRMKNSHVNDWELFVSTLSQRGTRHLDLRKMLVPVSDESCLYLPTAHSLENLHLGRVTPRVLLSILQSSRELRMCSAQIVKDGEGNEPIALNFSEGHKLEELQIQYLGGTYLNISSLDFSQVSSSIRKLSLLSLSGWNSLDWSSFQQLSQLTELELGDCCTLPSSFSDVLKSLTRLRKIRLERATEQCPVVELVGALNCLPNLEELELINIDIRIGFDTALGSLTQVKTLLLIPTYVVQSAKTIALVLQGTYQLRESLRKLFWIFTEELLKITELYFDQRLDKPKRGSGNSVPIISPVPMPEVKSGNPSLRSNIAERYNEESGGVVVVPLEQIHEMLLAGLPSTSIEVMKLPFQSTSRQSLADFR